MDGLKRSGVTGYLFHVPINRIIVWFGLALSSQISTAHEDPFERAVSGRAFYFENDELYAPKNDDRDYTMGLAVAVSGKNVTQLPIINWLDVSINFLTGIAPFLYPKSFQDFHYHVASIGDTAFTPDNLAAENPVVGDRPYANLLFISLNETSPNDSFTQAISNTLVIGALGLDIGKTFQRKLHSQLGATVPEGWNNQISDGGELTGMLNHTHKYLLINSAGPGTPELTFQYGAELGYYTDAAMRFNLRWGRLQSPWFLADLNTLRSAAPYILSVQPKKPLIGDFYFYAGIGARYFLYNALLQGQVRDNPYEISDSNLRRLVGEGTVGTALQIQNFEFRYEIGYRSSEISDGSGDKEHYFGGINIIYKY